MSDQQRFGYSRVLALLVLIASAIWFVLAFVRYLPEFIQEPDHLALLLPFLYWLATTAIALWTVVRPPKHIIRHAVRGVLSGALAAYVFTTFIYLRRPDLWGDGEFDLGVLFVVFLYAGVFFSLVGALVQSVVAAIVSVTSISD